MGMVLFSTLRKDRKGLPVSVVKPKMEKGKQKHTLGMMCLG